MARVFIGVGSNIDPQANVREAAKLLARDVHVVAISTVYLTDAEGASEQSAFYNGVIEAETELPAAQLKHSLLRRIEATLGRRRTADKYAARTVDLDLLLYDDLLTDTGDLVLPDPDIARRPFLAIPLFELAPELALPGTGERIAEIAARFSDHPMTPLPEFTQQLRKEIAHGHHHS